MNLLLLLLLIAVAAVSSESSNAGGDEVVYHDENDINLTPKRRSSLEDKSVHDARDDIIAAFEHSQHHHSHEQQVSGDRLMMNRDPSLIEPEEETENQESGENEDTEEEEGKDMEEGESSGEREDVHYHFHRKRVHQELEGETQEGEVENNIHHPHHVDVDEDIEGQGDDHSGANDDGSGHDLVVEEIHVHHDEPAQHIDSYHPRDEQRAKSEWQHFHAHLHSADRKSEDLIDFDDTESGDGSGDQDSEGSYSAESQERQKKALHIHRRVHSIHRHHATDAPMNSKHIHRHEIPDNEGGDEHSGDHDENLSNQIEPQREKEKGKESEHVHGEESIDHSADGISGDKVDEEEDIEYHHQQVHKAKHKSVHQTRLAQNDAAKHHHVHIHHQHKTPEQKSTAVPTTKAATETPTNPIDHPEVIKIPDSDIYIDENNKERDEEELHEVEIIQPGQHEVPSLCFHDYKTITNGTVVYMRSECRLCQCMSGQLQCEARSPNCTNHKPIHCMLERGGLMKDGEIHYDGCNRCLCRNGELLCTRLRCKSSGYNYTNYYAKADLGNAGFNRGRDACLECDHEPISAVCGPNGKTYRSLCHAFLCAGLKLEHLELGACEDLDPCQNRVCKGKNKICMSNQRAPCLAVATRAGKRVRCPQFKCAAIKESCPLQSEPDQVVCGIDGQTYPTECHLVSNSVLLAYRGSCRKACSDGDYQVCGVDAVTFESPCQANLYNQYIDYQGPCETYAAKPDVIIQEHGPDLYVKRRCSRLDKEARCPDLTCQQVVTPQGTCCPICGASLSIRLDTSVQDMIDLMVVRPTQDLNSLDAVYTAVASLQDDNTLDKCRITVDLADTNDIVSTFVPKRLYDLKACTDAARSTVNKIYSKTNILDPYQALLASAVLVEFDEIEESVVVKDGLSKRRVRRSEHHEHESIYPTPGNSTSTAVALQTTHFSSCFVALILSIMTYQLGYKNSYIPYI